MSKRKRENDRANIDVYLRQLESPVGMLTVATTADAICLVEFSDDGDRERLDLQIGRLQKMSGQVPVNKETDLHRIAANQLDEYFRGERTVFDLPIEFSGTEFQVRVWKRLAKIPFGRTTSYQAVAESIHQPGATRAVGTANGQNRIAIVLPCHRVVRRDGSLSGYGGGVWRKKWLLDHEQKTLF